jgi:glycosyltransferase involved in cell wall biosynthesis
MNIGIVTTWYPAGGGYVSKAYVQTLSESHNVYVYARGGKVMRRDPEWDHNNVYWAPRHVHGMKIKNFIKWLKRNKITIAFFNEQRYWRPVLEAKKIGVIVGSYIDYYTQSSIRGFALYDFLICNTKRHYSVFKWHKNCFYVPWGTDIQKFIPSRISTQRPLTFIHSAGWQGRSDGDRRGSLIALEAFSKLKGECKFIFFSQIKLGDCPTSWQNLIKGDERIVFRYGTYDPFPYTEGDVYIYPSRLDGIGLTLPEALSCGLPAITTDCPPMNEFVQDGTTGSLVKVEKYLGRRDGYYWAESICEIESITEAMGRYFDKDLLKSQSQNARDFAVKNLDWNKNNKLLIDIFSNAYSYKQEIQVDSLKMVKKLDNEMAPSFIYRAKSLIYDLIKSF